MGYGGLLIWTALAHNLKRAHPDKKILFIYRRGIRSILLRKPGPGHVIFINNPDIDLVLPKYKYFFQLRKFNKKNWIIVDMNNPKLHYWEKVTKEKIFHKRGENAIKIMCKYFKIKNVCLKPILKLTKKEITKVKKLLKIYKLEKRNFIVVEPSAKEGFTPNKKWFWRRWQKLVDLLRENAGQIVVQVGEESSPILSGVVSLVGHTSFREAAEVIGEAKLFIGTEGGLMHVARAMNTKAVILISGHGPLELHFYPYNINIYKKVECAPCGLNIPCPYGRKCMRMITVDEVYNNVLKLIKLEE